ncbi:tetraspanin-15 isoform X1 [Pristis pectinata]|uniref:tetraspanin-15 isoform X1 n=2 Tax=Pristis pectinata TaxID=685728 RepID=UPI00223DCF13|nr:tetraspanin-15 isoform X1 [Pristis pectinata]
MGGRSRLRCTGADAGYFILKLTLGVSATLFWLLGLLIMCVGIYAEVERQQNKTMEGFFVAPAVILVLLGVSIFVVSFAGMVGALRDNRLLLKMFKWTLVVVLLLELVFIIVCFLCRNKVLLIFKANVREGIKHYYEDLDFKNILDRIQTKFSCCGGDEYKDWTVNHYHACDAPGPMACGVPYTCCIREQEGDVINTQCGYQTLHQERLEVGTAIHARGCVDAVSLWFEDNIGITVGILTAILLPQVLGIVLSCLYLGKLSQHMDELDGFRMFVPYEQLDLSGAGWCLCLPREEGYQPMEEADIPNTMDPLQDPELMDAEQAELN